MPKIFGSAFVLQFIIAVNLALFLSDSSIDWSEGLIYGFFAEWQQLMYSLRNPGH